MTLLSETSVLYLIGDKTMNDILLNVCFALSGYFMFRSFKLEPDDRRDARLLAIHLQLAAIAQMLWQASIS